MHILLSLLMAVPAYAGWWGRLCERLIEDDPAQFEIAPDDWILRATVRLEIRERWGRLTEAETRELELLRKERARRDVYPVLRVP